MIVADWLVLATGVEARRSFAGIPVVRPWVGDAFDEVAGDEAVLILGTGLSMIDVVLSLDRLGYRGRITALSRVGYCHRRAGPLSDLRSQLKTSFCGGHFRRHYLAKEALPRSGLAAVIDGLRPHTQRLWRSMSLAQRRWFLRHALPYWNVRRHRVAPEVESQIAALRASGRLEIVAGRARRFERESHWIIAEIAKRGNSGIDRWRFGRLIDCRGVEDHVFRSSNRLIRATLASGAARPDPLGMGLDVDEEGALIDARSDHSRRVRAVGPPARAAFWECTAIPDIREQCRRMAEKIAKSAYATADLKRQPVLLKAC